MHKTLYILGVLSALLIGDQVYAQWTNPQLDNTHVGAISNDNVPVTWKLSLGGGSQNRTFSYMPNRRQKIAMRSAIECEDFLSGLKQLTRMDTNANGDITLYGAGDRKLAKFMQSESGDHESFWPNYPLMTLVPLK